MLSYLLDAQSTMKVLSRWNKIQFPQCVCVCGRACVPVCVHTCMCACMHACVCTCVCMCARACVCCPADTATHFSREGWEGDVLVGAQPHVALGLAVVHSTRREVVRLVLNQGPQLRAHLLRKQPQVHHSAIDGVAARCTQWGEKKDGCSQHWVGKQGYRVFFIIYKTNSLHMVCIL